MKQKNNTPPQKLPGATPAKWTIESTCPKQTEKLGRRIADLLPLGSVVALHGELASGKTCLVRGMAAHFDCKENVHSPTFTLINQYGREPTLYHADLYRINALAELEDLGYEDLFEPDGVCVIEWAGRADPLLPPKRLDIHFEHVHPNQPNTRRITIQNRGVLSGNWQSKLEKKMTK